MSAAVAFEFGVAVGLENVGSIAFLSIDMIWALPLNQLVVVRESVHESLLGVFFFNFSFSSDDIDSEVSLAHLEDFCDSLEVNSFNVLEQSSNWTGQLVLDVIVLVDLEVTRLMDEFANMVGSLALAQSLSRSVLADDIRDGMVDQLLFGLVAVVDQSLSH
jgi:hypothetical protein